MDHQSFMEEEQERKNKIDRVSKVGFEQQVIPKITPFTLEEIEVMREWFNSVLDVNPLYLKDYDIELAKKLYTMLKIRIPNELSNFSE